MNAFLADVATEYRKQKHLADGAIAQLAGDSLFTRLAPHANSPAIIVKHVAGNLRSRWTDFLTTDGDKPNRDRDGEFVVGPSDTRESLLAVWESAWAVLFATLASLRESDLDKTVTIRGEPHSVTLALLRNLAHTAYHAGQLTYIARVLHPDANWLTIAPGKSREFKPGAPASREAESR